MKFKELRELAGRQSFKLIIALIAGVVGILLIVGSELKDTKKESCISPDVASLDLSYEKELEKRLEEIISEIDGVGNVKVMVKTSGGEENEYAVDVNSSTDTGGQYKSDSQYVVIKGDKSEEGILLKRDYPEIEGVMIVCQGGNNSTVKNEITSAVASVLGISSNSISVTKMK